MVQFHMFSLLPLILIGILFFVFWIIILVDAVMRKFKESNDRLIWILVVILAGFIGALIYYFVVYFKDKSKSLKWLWITLLILILLECFSFVINIIY